MKNKENNVLLLRTHNSTRPTPSLDIIEHFNEKGGFIPFWTLTVGHCDTGFKLQTSQWTDGTPETIDGLAGRT